MTSKKRKVDAECRLFKEEWTWKYFFTEDNRKPICLICNEAVAVFKDFNLARHFNSKHANSQYASMDETERKINVEHLKSKLYGQRNMYIMQNNAQKTLAGYVVAYKIAKYNKPYSEGEFVKDCMVSASNILCPERTEDFETVNLSPETIAARIASIASNLSAQLWQCIEKFQYFSVTMVESTDASDTAQLLIFIRGIDDEFNITEELACSRSLKGKTTGQIIYNEFSEGLQSLNAPISKLCSITTDGASSMVGNLGFSGIFQDQSPNNDVVFLHCIIHQDVMFKAAIDITHVLNVVIKIINTIRSRGLERQKFQEFLMEVHKDYSDLLSHSSDHTKVRWLSCGYAFEQIWNLKEEVKDFLSEKWSDFQIFTDNDWLTDFAFFADLLEHYSRLNKKLQGTNQFLDEIWGYLQSFKIQISLFCNCMEKNDLTHFPRLKTMSPVSEKLVKFSEMLKKLYTEFETRFQDFNNIQSSLDVFSMPFNVDPENVTPELQLEIIEMQCSTHLKQLFMNSTKPDFYRILPKTEYPKMVAHAQKIMAMFGSSCISEQIFSLMVSRRNSVRYRLTDDQLFSLLKVSSSQLEPAFEDIMADQKQFYMPHTLTLPSSIY